MPAIASQALLRRLPDPAVRTGALARRYDEALADLRESGLIEAAYSYRILPLETSPSSWLTAGGERLHAPRLLPASGSLTALGFVACTLGPRLEGRVRALFGEKRPTAALALDELGSELLLALSRLAQDRLEAEAGQRGLSVAGELRSGDPGLDLGTQRAVLRLSGAETVGIGLTSGCLLTPVKSCTSVLGVGFDLPQVSWSRCDQCPSAPRCGIARRRKAPQKADEPEPESVP